MIHPTSTTRRLRAFTLAAVIAVAAVGCGNDDDDALPPVTTTTAPTADPGEAPTGENPTPEELVAPFAEIDEATMNAYCETVQLASPLSVDNVQPVVDAAPPEIAAEYENFLNPDPVPDGGTNQEAMVSLFRLMTLHQDVCGIPVKFG